MKIPMKPCPKCHMMIEKNMGCNHMTCKYCKNEFCWLCMAHYFPGHFDDNTGTSCAGKMFFEPEICCGMQEGNCCFDL